MIFPLIRFASFVFFARPSSAIISCHQQQQQHESLLFFFLFVIIAYWTAVTAVVLWPDFYHTLFTRALSLSLSLSGAV